MFLCFTASAATNQWPSCLGVRRVYARCVEQQQHEPFARARRAAVLAARAQGVPRMRYVPPLEAPREVHVRQVTLLLRGETPPRRARVRAAAAAAAASSGPIGTIGLL